MNDLLGKKLLVLGGTLSTYDVVRTAKEMGIYVVVTDYLKDGISKQEADETAYVSTNDMEKLEKLIEDEGISGVFTGASEFNIRNMIMLCSRTGLPCYLNLEQWDTFSNKRKFKEICKKNNIPVVPEYDLDNEEETQLEYPVIVKPEDSYSGHGISICFNKKELDTAVKKAKNWSKIGKVIIEKYIEGNNVEVYYLIQNGKIMLLTASDRYTDNNQNGSPVPTAFYHPSRFLDEYIKSTHPKVCRMFENIGVKNGVFFMESFLVNGTFMFYEMGFRLNATMEYHFVEYFNGFSPLKMMIRYALTGDMGADQEKNNNPHFSGKACEVALLLRPGTIHTVDGMDIIKSKDSVIHCIQFYEEGDCLEETGSLDQNFARIKVVAKTEEELEKEIEEIYRIISVKDTKGNEMLIKSR